MRASRSASALAFIIGVLFFSNGQFALADDKATIDANTQRALAWIRGTGGDTAALLDRAAGVLVFPDVIKMGFGVGGQFAEGVLVIGGKTVDYYAAAGETYGHLPNADYKAEVIFFMTEEALQAFRDTHSWKVGEDATVAVMSDPAAVTAAIDSAKSHVGLIFSEDGMVTDLVLDGVRVTRIVR
jgi:lipid-binding SYLF domain-containing protein